MKPKIRLPMGKQLWIIVASVVLLLMLYVASRDAPTPLLVSVVTRGSIKQEISDYGQTYYRDVLTVLAPTSGWLSKIHPRIGQVVQQGKSPLHMLTAALSPLLDTRTRATLQAQFESTRAHVDLTRAQLKRAQSAYQAAQENLLRSEKVLQAGALSQQDLDDLRARVNDLKQEVRAMQASLDSALHQRDAARAALTQNTSQGSDVLTVRAPRSGLVSWIYDEKPRFVTIGTPILDIASAGDLAFEADILAQDALKIRVGMPVRFPEFSIDGRVSALSPTAQPKLSALGLSEQRTRVWIEFVSAIPPEFPAGLELEAHIELAHKDDALVAPRTSVWTENNASFVFVEKDKKILKTQIVSGLQSNRDVEVLEGLQEGMRVVRLPTEHMQSGDTIDPKLRNP